MKRSKTAKPRDADVRALIDASRAQFPPGNAAGVVGMDHGVRITRGRRTERRTIRLYVERKVPGRAVPTVVCRRRTMKPDVIAVGRRLQAALATTGQFTGVHAGGTIMVRIDAAVVFGAIGTVLSADGESPSHLLTAGHLFPVGALGIPVICAKGPNRRPRAIGKVVLNLLDRKPESLGFALDLALVELNADGRALASDVDGRPPAPSILAGPATIDGRSVQPYRATINDYGTPDRCSLGHSVLHVSARPFRLAPYEVTNVIVTEHVVTMDGDSGTVLLDTEDHDVALGACIGNDGRSSQFEPLFRAIAALSDDFQTDLQLFSP